MKPIYLSGPIDGRTDNDTKVWREKATALLWLQGINTLNPMRRDYRNTDRYEVANEIVRLDEADIKNSYALLVMFDQPSVGTAMEVRMACKEIGMPVYVIDASDKPLSPWLIHHSTIIVKTLEEACELIARDYPHHV